MKKLTFVYCRPPVLSHPLGEVEVDEVLAKLAIELGLEGISQMRQPGSTSIAIPNVGPEEAWAAMDRVLPLWKQRRLFFLPRLG